MYSFFVIAVNELFLRYENNWFSTEEHSGTHLDAPAHFSEGQWRVDDIPAERLTGPGCVVDVRDKVGQDADYLVGQADFQAWERQHGPIPRGAILLANTGWWTRYPNRSLVFNTPTPSDASTFHFPGYDPDGVRWLIANRNVHILGIDTPSLDHGPSTDFAVHVVAFGANIAGLENVANVGSLPAKGFTVFVGVIKLEGGSGGPARVLAMVPDVTDRCSSLQAGVSLVWAVSLLALIRLY